MRSRGRHAAPAPEHHALAYTAAVGGTFVLAASGTIALAEIEHAPHAAAAVQAVVPMLLPAPPVDVLPPPESAAAPVSHTAVTVTPPAPIPAHATRAGPRHAPLLANPVPGARIVQGFKGAVHQGIDLAAPLGAHEFAAASGVVEFAGPASGFGDWIVIRSVVDGQIVDFVYGHEYATGVLVHVGEHVNVGDLIGLVGANGNATGPHCHFEVWIGGRTQGHPVDPVAWFAGHGLPL